MDAIMKNLIIRTKLLVSFAIIFVLFAATVFTAAGGIGSVKKQVQEFYDGPYTVKDRTYDMKVQFELLQANIFHAISTLNPDVTNDSVNKGEAAYDKIDSELAELVNLYHGDASIINEMRTQLASLKSDLDQVSALARQNTAESSNQAAVYMEKNGAPQIEKITTLLDQILDTAGTAADDKIIAVKNQVRTNMIFMVVEALITLLVCVLLSSYVTRMITRPLDEVVKAMKQVSEGDLNAHVEYESKDEIGQVTASLRYTTSTLKELIHDISYLLGEMAQGNFTVQAEHSEFYRGQFSVVLTAIKEINSRFNDALFQIGESANQVAVGSDQVSNSAQALSQGATQQASSVEELAAAISEISSKVQNNASYAAEVSSKVKHVGDELLSSNDQMTHMVDAMADISSSSNEIGKIIKTIEDIAFQTNILALNAAVEAARAGAAGKGFAVVADEVRNLASKSAEASNNTAALIESSIHSVEKGKQIVDKTAKSLLSVVEGTKEVIGTIDKISSATNEQAGSLSQITTGIDQISAVVQTNSATAEESAAASEELSGQAQLMKNMVGRFRLKDQDSRFIASQSMDQNDGFRTASITDQGNGYVTRPTDQDSGYAARPKGYGSSINEELCEGNSMADDSLEEAELQYDMDSKY